MTHTDKLIATLREAVAADIKAEIALLKRKLKTTEKQRDEWKQKAQTYREYMTKYQRELAALRSAPTSAPGSARPLSGSRVRLLTKTQRSRLTSGYC